jgi:hypothetical protein
MSINERASGLWTIDHPFTVGGLVLGARTSIIRDGAGQLALHSVGPLDDAAAAAIAALGPVTALIAPNLRHHLFVADAQRRFPQARLYAPAGLAAKRRDLTIDVLLPDDEAGALARLPPALAAVLEPIPVGGMPRLDETAWLHRPSRTLLLADLAFNIRPPAPWFTRNFMRLNGGFDRFGPTRFLRSFIVERARAQKGIERILARDFGRVVVGHGAVFEGDGRAALRREYAWLIGEGGTAIAAG